MKVNTKARILNGYNAWYDKNTFGKRIKETSEGSLVEVIGVPAYDKSTHEQIVTVKWLNADGTPMPVIGSVPTRYLEPING